MTLPPEVVALVEAVSDWLAWVDAPVSPNATVANIFDEAGPHEDRIRTTLSTVRAMPAAVEEVTEVGRLTPEQFAFYEAARAEFAFCEDLTTAEQLERLVDAVRDTGRVMLAAERAAASSGEGVGDV